MDMDSPADDAESPPGSGRTEAEWVVLRPDPAAVLVLDRDGRRRLPTSSLPGEVWLGDAPELTAALGAYGVDAILLGCRALTGPDDRGVQRLTLLARPRPGSEDPGPGTHWTDPTDVTDLLPAGVDPTDLGTVPAGRPPWEDPAWFPNTEHWLRERLADRDRPVTGRVEQRRSWELSSLLRAPTDAGAVWLKASAGSRLFADEGATMALLSGWFPDLVPNPLAWDHARRLLVLDEFGAVVGRGAPLDDRTRILHTYAGLQAATADRLPELRAAGLVDRGPQRLAAEARAWLADLEATAALPGLDPSSWLTPEESTTLRAALPRVVEACSVLAEGPVPVTLLHGDLHFNNVAAGPSGGPQFFDWTDACLGHPFLDLLTALPGQIHDEPAAPGGSADAIRLRDAYLAGWRPYADRRDLLQLWRAAEVAAALHHAVSYREIAAACAQPVDPHMGHSTAAWLRQLLSVLRRASTPS